MFVLLGENTSLLTPGGARHVVGAGSLQLALPGILPSHGVAKVLSWAHGGMRKEAFLCLLPFLPSFPFNLSTSRKVRIIWTSCARPGHGPVLGVGRLPTPTRSSWAGRPPCRRRRPAAP